MSAPRDPTPHEFAVPDLDRARRTGFPEVVYGAGKTPEELRSIAERLLSADPRLLVTRAGPEHFAALKGLREDLAYDPRARCITSGRPAHASGVVNVLAAGTSDLPVAEEAAITLEMSGVIARRIYDVGVAGLQYDAPGQAVQR